MNKIYLLTGNQFTNGRNLIHLTNHLADDCAVINKNCVIFDKFLSERLYKSNCDTNLYPEIDSSNIPINEYNHSILMDIWKLDLENKNIVILTYSAHVLNSFRIELYNKTISPEQFKVLFLELNSSKDNFSLKEIHFDNNGRSQDWCDGFFDKYEKDLIQLI